MLAGGAVYSVFGKSNTAKNSMLMRYNHVGDANDLNNMAFHMAAQADIMTLATGSVKLGTVFPGVNVDILGNLIINSFSLDPINVDTLMVTGDTARMQIGFGQLGGQAAEFSFKKVSTTDSLNNATFGLRGYPPVAVNLNADIVTPGDVFARRSIFSTVAMVGQRITTNITVTNNTLTAPMGGANFVDDPSVTTTYGLTQLSDGGNFYTNISGRVLYLSCINNIKWDNNASPFGFATSYWETGNTAIAVQSHAMPYAVNDRSATQTFALGIGASMSFYCYQNSGGNLDMLALITTYAGSAHTQRSRISLLVLN